MVILFQVTKEINDVERRLRNIKDVRPSDKFDNPYLIIPWVTNDNSEHLCELMSGTFFRVFGTLLNLHEHCPYITYNCFFVRVL